MKFDLSTFLFQIINFIVLLFILKRVLYKPVREIIEKRRGLIAKTVQDAEQTKQEALELKEKYQEEMATLKDLRTQQLEKLQKEVAEERKKLINRAEEGAAAVMEKERAVMEMEEKRLYGQLKEHAVDTACVFASHLLRDISDEQLHRATYGKLLQGLDEIASDLSGVTGKEGPLAVEVASAYPFDREELEKLQHTFESLLGRKVVIAATVDETLIAGAKIKAYDKVYNYSLSGQVDLLRTRLEETA
jgi:F-type H+-transporting ATPase subunit b